MTAPAHSILPLKVENLSYRANGLVLIDSVSFALERPVRTVILGPNGAGKSLLLRLCHGLIPPSGGQVAWNAPDPARHQAMVFQRPVLLRRGVAANVGFGLRLRGVGRAERRARVAEALALAGLTDLADRPARVLSVGEQQRLALVRAWILRPEILFLDEPTANLDPAATRAVESVIDAIHRAGTGIVLTTQDLHQARRLADQILFLHRGRLIERAPAERFFAGPASLEGAAFIKGDLVW